MYFLISRGLIRPRVCRRLPLHRVAEVNLDTLSGGSTLIWGRIADRWSKVEPTLQQRPTLVWLWLNPWVHLDIEAS